METNEDKIKEYKCEREKLIEKLSNSNNEDKQGIAKSIVYVDRQIALLEDLG